ncbi:hypothetical protein N657DRAFT_669603 [Parathielavia appendiculata]|uniref:Uncharacterized protein n=1 Tax=Parathielavia appendiculata TaxID=2587402 RepID=A0AAN6Z7F9_9PEZI|nr:hypothetical protein N657DRAFT_669603 [Parathielavia appendiculata]
MSRRSTTTPNGSVSAGSATTSTPSTATDNQLLFPPTLPPLRQVLVLLSAGAPEALLSVPIDAPPTLALWPPLWIPPPGVPVPDPPLLSHWQPPVPPANTVVNRLPRALEPSATVYEDLHSGQGPDARRRRLPPWAAGGPLPQPVDQNRRDVLRQPGPTAPSVSNIDNHPLGKKQGVKDGKRHDVPCLTSSCNAWG